MTYKASDFGPGKIGPQFAWLDQRLTVHGFGFLGWDDTFRDRVARFQRAQGWSGSGADGLIGPLTLTRLTADPVSEPTEPTDPTPAKINLSDWKITLPTADKGKPRELFPIGNHEDSPWFVQHGDGITFRANCGGATTSNSGYPRSELREMTKSGGLAAWSSKSGVHTMSGRLAITHLPDVKKHVVCAQIHDAEDDVCMVRLEGVHLFVESPHFADLTLDTNYQLGAYFQLKVEATPAGITVTYNGKSVFAKGVVGKGWYFKAGCYTQSNLVKGDRADAYGEVFYSALEVSHA